jgi:HSP20 family molecular chaperone IbpA
MEFWDPNCGRFAPEIGFTLNTDPGALDGGWGFPKISVVVAPLAGDGGLPGALASGPGPCFDPFSLTMRRQPMTRVSVFSSPLLLGFDHIERVLDRVNKTAAEGYPPYNIEQVGEHRLRITLAVAGFAEPDLSVNVEDNQLVIRGKREDDDSKRVFLHRGIAARQFTRSFVLAEGIEVRGAEMVNGLLHIDLERPVPQPKVTQIEIKSASKKKPMRTIDVDVEP